MTVCKYLFAVVVACLFIDGARNVSAADASTSTSSPALAPDGTPVIHKSSHKKKPKATASDTAATHPTSTSPAATEAEKKPKPSDSVIVTKAPAPVSFSATPPAVSSSKPVLPVAPLPVSPEITTPATTEPVSYGPTVETGLPVARHDGSSSASVNYSGSPSASYRSSIFSTLSPLAPDPSLTRHSTSSSSSTGSFAFTNFEKKTHTYPWKVDIITTIFWIGEGDTPISTTTNEASAWDESWQETNGGKDLPKDLKGYASGAHASTVNPFYVALPFNDLAFPDKARRWMPSWWFQPPRNGKQVSGCQHRWVEIKNAQGDHCYAQWEDVGPLRYDHAEYVFGSDRPDTYSRAGLDVSPAVAKYLNIDGKNNITRWRFVDAEDVPPGFWLKLDEQALLYKALKEAKNMTSPSSLPSNLPIQRALAPIDSGTIDANKKKVGAAKG